MVSDQSKPGNPPRYYHLLTPFTIAGAFSVLLLVIMLYVDRYSGNPSPHTIGSMSALLLIGPGLVLFAIDRLLIDVLKYSHLVLLELAVAGLLLLLVWL